VSQSRTKRAALLKRETQSMTRPSHLGFARAQQKEMGTGKKKREMHHVIKCGNLRVRVLKGPRTVSFWRKPAHSVRVGLKRTHYSSNKFPCPDPSWLRTRGNMVLRAWHRVSRKTLRPHSLRMRSARLHRAAAVICRPGRESQRA